MSLSESLRGLWYDSSLIQFSTLNTQQALSVFSQLQGVVMA